MTTATAGLSPLRLLGRTKHAFSGADATVARTRDPGELRYYTDLAGVYGRSVRPEVLSDEGLLCHSDMAEVLVVKLSLTDPVDVVVVGHIRPDLDVGRFAGLTIGEAAPGNAMVVAVTDQGAATPFAALRLAGLYAGARTLVVLLDQSALPYDLPAGAAEQLHDSGVALLLGPSADGGSGVRQWADVDREDIAGLIADAWPDNATTLVLGPGIDPHSLDWSGEVINASAGRPATGLWWSLPETACGTVLLADHDPTLRYLSVAAVDLGRP